MAVRVAINAAPLIFLSKAGILGLLSKLFDKIYTTTLVIEEVRFPYTLGIEAPEIPAILNASWLEVVELTVSEKKRAEKLATQLRIQKGEAEVAVLYERERLDALIVGDEVAESKLKQRGINVKDMTEIGIFAASKGVYDLQNFLKAIYEVGYRTRRVRNLLS